VTISGYSDKNTRGFLHCRIEVPVASGTQMLDVFNAHFPYDQQQQCPTVVRIYEILSREFGSSLKEIPQVLLGDLNIYLDFEWPIDFLQYPLNSFTTGPFNPCGKIFAQALQAFSNPEPLNFRDVWSDKFVRNPDGKLHMSSLHLEIQSLGHTFPLFKDNALDNCRPDRILVRGDLLQVNQVLTIGGESFSVGPFKQFLSDHLGVLMAFSFKS
jgi:hypothetical protein